MPSILVVDPNSGIHYPLDIILLGDGNYALAVASHSNATRATAIVHRNVITTADKMLVPGTQTVTVVACTGASAPLVNATPYFTAVSAANKYGPTGPGALPSSATATTGNLALQIAFAQVTGVSSGDATTGYDIFLGITSGAPLWVARITEAQRAAGCIVTAVGTVTTSSSNGSTPSAGSVIVQTVGTGVASNVNPFLYNNAYTPETVAGVGSVNCAGYARAHIKAYMNVTDLRSPPTLTITPFLLNGSDGFWDQAQVTSVNMATALGQSLRQEFEMDVDGATGLVVCVVPGGQAPKVTIVVELA